MVAKVFKSILKPLMAPIPPTDYEKAADAIATAYDLSNVGMSMTIFGSILMQGNKETLKSFLLQGLTMNSGLTKYLPVVEPGWTLMANGFCLYWATATFTPLPPMPPTISPLTGTQVLFPGSPSILDIGLKVAFTAGFQNPTEGKLGGLDNALDILSLVLIAHQLTIAGTYNGLIPAAPSPIPFLAPWAAIIGVPDVDIKDSDVSTSGTSGTSTTSGTSGTSTTSGTSGTSAIDSNVEKINNILSKINELNKLNDSDLQNRSGDLNTISSDLDKLLADPNIIKSKEYQRLVSALSQLVNLKNRINKNISVSEERFPYSGDCVDCS